MYKGDILPAEAHERLTQNPQAVLIDVRTLDHVIVAGDKTMAFAERGWL